MDFQVESSDSELTREQAIDEMAVLLPAEAAMLVRLVFREVHNEVTRPLAGVLKSLDESPLRITELAEKEGLAQATATALVDQAEKRGWVRRERGSTDKRVVMVSITTSGRTARRKLHREISRVMHEHTGAMADAEVFAALEATRALQPLITALRAPTA